MRDIGHLWNLKSELATGGSVGGKTFIFWLLSCSGLRPQPLEKSDETESMLKSIVLFQFGFLVLLTSPPCSQTLVFMYFFGGIHLGIEWKAAENQRKEHQEGHPEGA